MSPPLGRGLSLLAAALVSALAGALWGGFIALAALSFLGGLAFCLWVWLPRAAHRAFRRGRADRARALYRVQRALRADPRARAQLRVSLVACALARGDPDAVPATLGEGEPAHLGEAGRAAWLNNRAYARARQGTELDRALADIDAALALHPHVAGFRHTRGVVLLALGRTDEAIRELDAAWREHDDDDDAPAWEAERCYDLGVAWSRKGEREYAADYYARARRAAPASPWGRRAAERAAKAPA